MATSPTQLSLKKMRTDGFNCEIVEHWNPFARVRKDLFGFVDILCIKKDAIVGVQCTSRSNVSARINKIRNHVNFKSVVSAGIFVEVHGWSKIGGKWECVVVKCPI